MEWEELQRRRSELTKEATKALTKEQVNLLVWLIEEERKTRFAAKGGNKIPSALREQLQAIVPNDLVNENVEGQK